MTTPMVPPSMRQRTPQVFAFLFIVLQGIPLALAGPPPNDNFQDRTLLGEESALVDVDLQDSTQQIAVDPVGQFSYLLEPWVILTDPGCDPQGAGCHPGSVWWEWTPAHAGAVIVHWVNVRPNLDPPGLAVYRKPAPDRAGVTPIPTEFADLLAVAGTASSLPRHAVRAIEVRAGEALLIQAFASSPRRGRFRIEWVRQPVIAEQPGDRTLIPGQSTFLSVVALPSLSADLTTARLPRFQWLHEGVPMAGQTSAALLLSRVSASEAGGYAVVVSDGRDSVTSRVAVVTVSAVESPPVLSPTLLSPGRTGPAWNLEGEAGRVYVIESSTNLAGGWQWQPVVATAFEGPEPYLTSVLRNGQGAAHVWMGHHRFGFTVPPAAPRTLFLRARRVQPIEEERVAILWIIDLAKEQWAREASRAMEAVHPISEVDLAPLLVGLPLSAIAGNTPCRAGVTLGFAILGSGWPCVPYGPDVVWDEYWMSAPAPVWNLQAE